MERRNGSGSRAIAPTLAAALVLASTVLAAGILPAAAAQPFKPIEAERPALPASPAKATPAVPGQVDRLVVQAQQLVYDRDHDIVSAVGNVQLYYQGRVLEADKVTYNRRTSRVFAEGNAKLTEADGTVAYGERFDLTDDFKSGFIDSLSAVTPQKTYFTSPRGERIAGETSTFDKATYTACEPCKEHPERPPLWQIKAMKIIHNKDRSRWSTSRTPASSSWACRSPTFPICRRGRPER